MSEALSYAQLLAVELGKDWAAEDAGDREALLHGPHDQRVSVQPGDAAYYARAADRGRVRFAALLPRELHGFGQNTPDITVAAARPAAAVAKELERRMLVGYRDRMARARAAKRDRDAREAERARLVDQAAAVLGVLGEVNVWDRNPRHHGDPCGKLSVGSYRDRVQIELAVERTSNSDFPPEAKATVRVHRDLLPRLAAALATLAEETQ